MTEREFDPFHLDVAAFAGAGAELDGLWPLARLARLAAMAVPVAQAGVAPGDAPAPMVQWRVRGERRPAGAGRSDPWLHVVAATEAALECQRCLEPVVVPIEVERSFRFVEGEDAAAALDAESDEEVLSLTRTLDLRVLVEDELLLALPLVPRHAVCPTPLPVPSAIDAADVDTDSAAHPFAALAALKPSGPAN